MSRDSEKIALIAGVADDQGYGWAIAKALANQGVKIILATWPPVYKIFKKSLESGKLDASRKLDNGQKMEFEKVYPLDASFDTPEDVPEDIRENKRYKEYSQYSISELAQAIERDFGKIDYFVHSLANGPEVQKDLLDTSRKGYLAALSASSYSFVSLLSHLGPHMNPHGAALCLSYIASEKIIPGYGGGMSSAKAALESDTRTLAWEAGRKWHVRVNCISAGPLGSRAAKAIGFIDKMINYSQANAPLGEQNLCSEDIGNSAAFLLSSKAKAITGVTLYVDNGMHAMGAAMDSPAFQEEKA